MSEVVAYKDSNNNYWDTEVENSTPIKHKSEDALNIMRHDMAHILAEAVISLFPNAKPTIGPFIKKMVFIMILIWRVHYQMMI